MCLWTNTNGGDFVQNCAFFLHIGRCAFERGSMVRMFYELLKMSVIRVRNGCDSALCSSCLTWRKGLWDPVLACQHDLTQRVERPSVNAALSLYCCSSLTRNELAICCVVHAKPHLANNDLTTSRSQSSHVRTHLALVLWLTKPLYEH